jgi:hypothetical protein
MLIAPRTGTEGRKQSMNKSGIQQLFFVSVFKKIVAKQKRCAIVRK